MSASRTGWAILCIAAALALASCGGGNEDAATAPETAGDAAPTVTDVSPAAETDENTPTDETGDAGNDDPAEADSTSTALADSLGLATIEILTPTSGGGDRPALSWTPVQGAETYQVTLLAPDGTFYWGWTGGDASVPVGGLPRLIPEAGGPRLIPSMSWTVLAFDADVLPIAAAGPAQIGP